MQQRNLLLFFVLSALLTLTYYQIRVRTLPTKTSATKDVETKKLETKRSEFKATNLPPLAPITPEAKLLTLGEDHPDSKYNVQVVLDPLGGGVRSITLNKFRAATEDGTPGGDVLPLVPSDVNLHEPSHLLLHYPANDTDNRPFDTLGRRAWEVEGTPSADKVTFKTEIDGVIVRKTFTLAEGDYHVGLQIDLELPAEAKESRKFRYQLTGAKGLPIEGKWYTSTFRNALIGLENNDGYVFRELEDLRQLSLWGGGNPVLKDSEKFIRYAGTAVQYFASVIVVDDEQVERQDQRFLQRAVASLETGVARGRIKASSLDQTDRIVLTSDDRKHDTIIYLPADDSILQAKRAMLKEDVLVAVVYEKRSYDEKLKECPKVATEINFGIEGQATHPLWIDDVTVRVSTDKIDLKPGEKKSHRYLLYNGPVKPSLLRGLRGDREVSDELIARYVDTLHLNTLTDYHSPGAMGRFANAIYWTPLIIKCTNLMHWVLGKMHLVIPSYGLSIILLTVLVRLLMFPLSRRQALMSIKMQALQPEMKKLAERYKDDQQGRAQAQMELFRRHGVNPIGSCWVILIQMPIFMGLYFALQESIQFRLASFWPTWIVNLAAPDMLFGWGRSIPFISRDADYGGMFYLGPYFNLLPIFAVTLMVVQQKMMMPPPADKEQELQQKMMRIMMLVMGIFFYKIAAGLCIYIITSTLWGFAERKLLPKAEKLAGNGTSDPASAPGTAMPTASNNGGPSGSIATAGKKPGREKRKADRIKSKDAQKSGGEGLGQKISAWWKDVLEQARKK